MLRVLVSVLLYFFFISQSFAAMSLQIKNSEIGKTKIVFLGFDPISTLPGSNLRSDAETIFDQIEKNLGTTGLFEVVKENQQRNYTPVNSESEISASEAVIQNIISVEAVPDFEEYAKSGVGIIIIAQFDYSEIGNLEIRMRVWDVLDQRQLFGKFYTASYDNYIRVANMISDEIFKAVTGESVGHFNSKIIYVSESGSVKRRIKKIHLMNFDGSDNRVLTDGRDLVLTPVFAKTRDDIFYLRYFDNRPQIFSLNTENLRIKKIGGFRATTLTPEPHPTDPNIILLTAIFNGNSDIYKLNISDNKAIRLTNGSSIETTPSYSPDGKYIAFSSDRGAGQKIYIMDSDGSSIRNLTDLNSPGSYSKPVWSPDGKLIAFTKIRNGEFFIGVISTDGRGEKLLSSGYLVEGARWSPNGRYLIYSKKRSHYGKGAIPRLFIVDIITGFEFEVPTPKNEGATDPDWAL